MTVAVAPVPGEGTRDNNRIQYQVAFTANKNRIFLSGNPESGGRVP